jgi:tetratricopeptide (TPR) repeat protein
MHLNELASASADFKEAFRLDPQFPYSYTGMGYMAFIREDFRTTLENFIKADELLPEKGSTLAAMALAYHALGQVEEAVKIWQGLIEKDVQYRDAGWARQEHTWPDALVEEARKLLARL